MLTNYEIEVAKELINIALSNAADAFSRMASEKVKIKECELQILDRNQIIETIDTISDQNFILTTEVKGLLLAKSYLMFNSTDINKVIKIFTKEEVDIVNGELTEYQKAILLELDNIVSAAMVTQISNIFDLFTYGDVPHLHFMSHEEMMNMFTNDIKEYEIYLSVHARFKTVNTSMAPSFIWLFKADFLEAIKELIKGKKHFSHIKQK